MKIAIIFVSVFFSSAVFSANELPDIGDSIDAVMSLEEEKKIGKEFMRSVRNSLDLLQDPVINEYIQTLGEHLASQIDAGEQNFTFFVVNDSTINAFAGPGGYIGIHTGLILATESEDELASVMAHEIAHVTQRHLVRSLSASSNMTVPAIAAIIAAIILGQGNSEISEAVIASTIAGTTQSQLNFSRVHEKEADRVGIEMMAKTGYDPIAMPHFFETLQKSHRYADGNIPEFILTHPVTASRIADSTGRAEQYSRVHRTPEQTINYELVRARVYQFSNTVKPSTFTVKAAQQLTPKNNHYSKRYQYILALDAKKNYREAKKAIADLIKDDNARVPYFVTQAEIEMQNEKWREAIDLLGQGLMVYPHNVPMTLLYAECLIRDNNGNQAMKILEDQIRQPSSPINYFKLYAEAAQQTGQVSVAHESLGEYHYRLGNLHTAIKQFQRSLKENNNNEIRALRLKARIDELKTQVLNNQPVRHKENHLLVRIG